MCNLYSNTMPQEAMRHLFEVSPEHDRLGNFAPLPAIFPRYSAPVVRLAATGERELVSMQWGFLLPQLSTKTGKPILPKAVTNARDDKLQASPFWRGSFAERRCLVPATSFAEAMGHPATYYWFGLVADDPHARPPFAFAGLWRSFRGEYRGELVEIETHTIITTSPNALVRQIHPERMPVILDLKGHETWLGGSANDSAHLLRSYPAERMRIVRRGAERQDVAGENGV
jgi:putative SOS response-associated peptidase YedK